MRVRKVFTVSEMQELVFVGKMGKYNWAGIPSNISPHANDVCYNGVWLERELCVSHVNT